MTAPARSMRTSLACTIKKQPGTLTVVEPAHAGVKAEKAAGVVVTADAADFVALWASSSAAAAEASSFRLDLRCDVVDLLVASKPPATSAKVALSKERVAQGHLGPCAGSFVATFDSTEQRQTFVDAVKYWRLGVTEAAALRALAAAAAATSSQGPDAAAAAAEGANGGGATATIDSKELVMAGSARVKAEEDAAHSGAEMPAGVEIIGVAQRARERAWVRHDATLRQLFDALVTSGVITEDEFASAHAEEKAAFFSEVPEVNQRLGLDSLSDALSDIVDPDTHQLRPVTEQVAANIFAQSPALASVYRQRVQSSEDEMVFWDAVIRRVLFLSRTLLDRYDATATKKEDADTVTTGGSNAADTVSNSWNERSEAALRLLEAERGGADAAVGKRIARPAGTASDAAEDARQRRAVGRHRREAGDAEATGGLGGNGVIELDRDALFAHARMSDLETAGVPRANAAKAHRDSEGGDTESDQAYWTSRLEESFGCDSFRSPGGSGGVQTSFRLTSEEDRAAHSAALSAVCASFEAALAEREAAPAVDHGGLWEGMMRVQPAIDLFALWGAKGTMADSVRAKKAPAVPLQLRTCHSLHRLFFRQLLACQAQARALQGVPPSAAEAAARARCGEVLDALKRARAKAFADPPEGVDEAARDGPWAAGTRKVDHLVAKADAAFADAKEQWGA